MEQFDETSYSWNLKALQVEKFFLKRRKQKVKNVKRKKKVLECHFLLVWSEISGNGPAQVIAIKPGATHVMGLLN